MRKWNRLRSFSLMVFASAFGLAGIARADDFGFADEPPAELFATSPTEKPCHDYDCADRTGAAFSTWFDLQPVHVCCAACGEWTSIPFGDHKIELAQYLDSTCPYIASGGAASGSYPAWQPECGHFGCDQKGILATPAESLAAELHGELKPGETAEILLEIRDQLGLDSLDGTVYQPVDAPTQSIADNAFVNEIRASEVEETCAKPDCEAAGASEVAPTWKPRTIQNTIDRGEPPAALVQLLRAVSRQLEASADQLEDQEMYFRADQLRDVATELRLEARSAGGEWALSPLGAVPRTTTPRPERDLERENEELRAEIERLRESLRADAADAETKVR